MLQFHIMPRGLDLFVERVVPDLQRRGLLRDAYTGATLREHLGLRASGAGRAGPATNGVSHLKSILRRLLLVAFPPAGLGRTARLR